VTSSSMFSFTAVRSASVNMKTGHRLTRQRQRACWGRIPSCPDLRH
jgi:hypothetical protein